MKHLVEPGDQLCQLEDNNPLAWCPAFGGKTSLPVLYQVMRTAEGAFCHPPKHIPSQYRKQITVGL